eukprot:Nk52_evm15s235 gene=Nk52_evmTU15s235
MKSPTFLCLLFFCLCSCLFIAPSTASFSTQSVETESSSWPFADALNSVYESVQGHLIARGFLSDEETEEEANHAENGSRLVTRDEKKTKQSTADELRKVDDNYNKRWDSSLKDYYPQISEGTQVFKNTPKDYIDSPSSCVGRYIFEYTRQRQDFDSEYHKVYNDIGLSKPKSPYVDHKYDTIFKERQEAILAKMEGSEKKVVDVYDNAYDLWRHFFSTPGIDGQTREAIEDAPLGKIQFGADFDIYREYPKPPSEKERAVQFYDNILEVWYRFYWQCMLDMSKHSTSKYFNPYAGSVVPRPIRWLPVLLSTSSKTIASTNEQSLVDSLLYPKLLFDFANPTKIHFDQGSSSGSHYSVNAQSNWGRLTMTEYNAKSRKEFDIYVSSPTRFLESELTVFFQAPNIDYDYSLKDTYPILEKKFKNHDLFYISDDAEIIYNVNYENPGKDHRFSGASVCLRIGSSMRKELEAASSEVGLQMIKTASETKKLANEKRSERRRRSNQEEGASNEVPWKNKRNSTSTKPPGNYNFKRTTSTNNESSTYSRLSPELDDNENPIAFSKKQRRFQTDMSSHSMEEEANEDEYFNPVAKPDYVTPGAHVSRLFFKDYTYQTCSTRWNNIERVTSTLSGMFLPSLYASFEVTVEPTTQSICFLPDNEGKILSDDDAERECEKSSYSYAKGSPLLSYSYTEQMCCGDLSDYNQNVDFELYSSELLLYYNHLQKGFVVKDTATQMFTGSNPHGGHYRKDEQGDDMTCNIDIHELYDSHTKNIKSSENKQGKLPKSAFLYRGINFPSTSVVFENIYAPQISDGKHHTITFAYKPASDAQHKMAIAKMKTIKNREEWIKSLKEDIFQLDGENWEKEMIDQVISLFVDGVKIEIDPYGSFDVEAYLLRGPITRAGNLHIGSRANPVGAVSRRICENGERRCHTLNSKSQYELCESERWVVKACPEIDPYCQTHCTECTEKQFPICEPSVEDKVSNHIYRCPNMFGKGTRYVVKEQCGEDEVCDNNECKKSQCHDGDAMCHGDKHRIVCKSNLLWPSMDVQEDKEYIEECDNYCEKGKCVECRNQMEPLCHENTRIMCINNVKKEESCTSGKDINGHPIERTYGNQYCHMKEGESVCGCVPGSRIEVTSETYKECNGKGEYVEYQCPKPNIKGLQTTNLKSYSCGTNAALPTDNCSKQCLNENLLQFCVGPKREYNIKLDGKDYKPVYQHSFDCSLINKICAFGTCIERECATGQTKCLKEEGHGGIEYLVNCQRGLWSEKEKHRCGEKTPLCSEVAPKFSSPYERVAMCVECVPGKGKCIGDKEFQNCNMHGEWEEKQSCSEGEPEECRLAHDGRAGCARVTAEGCMSKLCKKCASYLTGELRVVLDSFYCDADKEHLRTKLHDMVYGPGVEGVIKIVAGAFSFNNDQVKRITETLTSAFNYDKCTSHCGVSKCDEIAMRLLKEVRWKHTFPSTYCGTKEFIFKNSGIDFKLTYGVREEVESRMKSPYWISEDPDLLKKANDFAAGIYAKQRHPIEFQKVFDNLFEYTMLRGKGRLDGWPNMNDQCREKLLKIYDLSGSKQFTIEMNDHFDQFMFYDDFKETDDRNLFEKMVAAVKKLVWTPLVRYFKGHYGSSGFSLPQHTIYECTVKPIEDLPGSTTGVCGSSSICKGAALALADTFNAIAQSAAARLIVKGVQKTVKVLKKIFCFWCRRRRSVDERWQSFVEEHGIGVESYYNINFPVKQHSYAKLFYAGAPSDLHRRSEYIERGVQNGHIFRERHGATLDDSVRRSYMEDQAIAKLLKIERLANANTNEQLGRLRRRREFVDNGSGSKDNSKIANSEILDYDPSQVHIPFRNAITRTEYPYCYVQGHPGLCNELMGNEEVATFMKGFLCNVAITDDVSPADLNRLYRGEKKDRDMLMNAMSISTHSVMEFHVRMADEKKVGNLDYHLVYIDTDRVRKLREAVPKSNDQTKLVEVKLSFLNYELVTEKNGSLESESNDRYVQTFRYFPDDEDWYVELGQLALHLGRYESTQLHNYEEMMRNYMFTHNNPFTKQSLIGTLNSPSSSMRDYQAEWQKLGEKYNIDNIIVHNVFDYRNLKHNPVPTSRSHAHAYDYGPMIRVDHKTGKVYARWVDPEFPYFTPPELKKNKVYPKEDEPFKIEMVLVMKSSDLSNTRHISDYTYSAPVSFSLKLKGAFIEYDWKYGDGTGSGATALTEAQLAERINNAKISSVTKCGLALRCGGDAEGECDTHAKLGRLYRPYVDFESPLVLSDTAPNPSDTPSQWSRTVVRARIKAFQRMHNLGVLKLNGCEESTYDNMPLNTESSTFEIHYGQPIVNKQNKELRLPKGQPLTPDADYSTQAFLQKNSIGEEYQEEFKNYESISYASLVEIRSCKEHGVGSSRAQACVFLNEGLAAAFGLFSGVKDQGTVTVSLPLTISYQYIQEPTLFKKQSESVVLDFSFEVQDLKQGDTRELLECNEQDIMNKKTNCEKIKCSSKSNLKVCLETWTVAVHTDSSIRIADPRMLDDVEVIENCDVILTSCGEMSATSDKDSQVVHLSNTILGQLRDMRTSSLSIATNNNLRSMNAFPFLQRIDGTLSITNNAHLCRMTGFESLEGVVDFLFENNCHEYAPLEGPNRETEDKTPPELFAFTGSGAGASGGYLDYVVPGSNTVDADFVLSGFPKLREVLNNFVVRNIGEYQAIDGFPLLAKISCNFQVKSNENLKFMSFPTLQSARSVSVKNNGKGKEGSRAGMFYCPDLFFRLAETHRGKCGEHQKNKYDLEFANNDELKRTRCTPQCETEVPIDVPIYYNFFNPSKGGNRKEFQLHPDFFEQLEDVAGENSYTYEQALKRVFADHSQGRRRRASNELTESQQRISYLLPRGCDAISSEYCSSRVGWSTNELEDLLSAEGLPVYRVRPLIRNGEDEQSDRHSIFTEYTYHLWFHPTSKQAKKNRVELSKPGKFMETASVSKIGKLGWKFEEGGNHDEEVFTARTTLFATGYYPENKDPKVREVGVFKVCSVDDAWVYFDHYKIIDLGGIRKTNEKYLKCSYAIVVIRPPNPLNFDDGAYEEKEDDYTFTAFHYSFEWDEESKGESPDVCDYTFTKEALTAFLNSNNDILATEKWAEKKMKQCCELMNKGNENVCDIDNADSFQYTQKVRSPATEHIRFAKFNYASSEQDNTPPSGTLDATKRMPERSKQIAHKISLFYAKRIGLKGDGPAYSFTLETTMDLVNPCQTCSKGPSGAVCSKCAVGHALVNDGTSSICMACSEFHAQNSVCGSQNAPLPLKRVTFREKRADQTDSVSMIDLSALTDSPPVQTACPPGEMPNLTGECLPRMCPGRKVLMKGKLTEVQSVEVGEVQSIACEASPPASEEEDQPVGPEDTISICQYCSGSGFWGQTINTCQIPRCPAIPKTKKMAYHDRVDPILREILHESLPLDSVDIDKGDAIFKIPCKPQFRTGADNYVWHRCRAVNGKLTRIIVDKCQGISFCPPLKDIFMIWSKPMEGGLEDTFENAKSAYKKDFRSCAMKPDGEGENECTWARGAHKKWKESKSGGSKLDLDTLAGEHIETKLIKVKNMFSFNGNNADTNRDEMAFTWNPMETATLGVLYTPATISPEQSVFTDQTQNTGPCHFHTMCKRSEKVEYEVTGCAHSNFKNRKGYIENPVVVNTLVHLSLSGDIDAYLKGAFRNSRNDFHAIHFVEKTFYGADNSITPAKSIGVVCGFSGTVLGETTAFSSTIQRQRKDNIRSEWSKQQFGKSAEYRSLTPEWMVRVKHEDNQKTVKVESGNGMAIRQMVQSFGYVKGIQLPGALKEHSFELIPVNKIDFYFVPPFCPGTKSSFLAEPFRPRGNNPLADLYNAVVLIPPHSNKKETPKYRYSFPTSDPYVNQDFQAMLEDIQRAFDDDTALFSAKDVRSRVNYNTNQMFFTNTILITRSTDSIWSNAKQKILEGLSSKADEYFVPADDFCLRSEPVPAKDFNYEERLGQLVKRSGEECPDSMQRVEWETLFDTYNSNLVYGSQTIPCPGVEGSLKLVNQGKSSVSTTRTCSMTTGRMTMTSCEKVIPLPFVISQAFKDKYLLKLQCDQSSAIQCSEEKEKNQYKIFSEGAPLEIPLKEEFFTVYGEKKVRLQSHYLDTPMAEHRSVEMVRRSEEIDGRCLDSKNKRFSGLLEWVEDYCLAMVRELDDKGVGFPHPACSFYEMFALPYSFDENGLRMVSDKDIDLLLSKIQFSVNDTKIAAVPEKEVYDGISLKITDDDGSEYEPFSHWNGISPDMCWYPQKLHCLGRTVIAPFDSDALNSAFAKENNEEVTIELGQDYGYETPPMDRFVYRFPDVDYDMTSFALPPSVAHGWYVLSSSDHLYDSHTWFTTHNSTPNVGEWKHFISFPHYVCPSKPKDQEEFKKKVRLLSFDSNLVTNRVTSVQKESGRYKTDTEILSGKFEWKVKLLKIFFRNVYGMDYFIQPTNSNFKSKFNIMKHNFKRGFELRMDLGLYMDFKNRSPIGDATDFKTNYPVGEYKRKQCAAFNVKTVSSKLWKSCIPGTDIVEDLEAMPMVSKPIDLYAEIESSKRILDMLQPENPRGSYGDLGSYAPVKVPCACVNKHVFDPLEEKDEPYMLCVNNPFPCVTGLNGNGGVLALDSTQFFNLELFWQSVFQNILGESGTTYYEHLDIVVDPGCKHRVAIELTPANHMRLLHKFVEECVTITLKDVDGDKEKTACRGGIVKEFYGLLGKRTVAVSEDISCDKTSDVGGAKRVSEQAMPSKRAKTVWVDDGLEAENQKNCKTSLIVHLLQSGKLGCQGKAGTVTSTKARRGEIEHIEPGMYSKSLATPPFFSMGVSTKSYYGKCVEKKCKELTAPIYAKGYNEAQHSSVLPSYDFRKGHQLLYRKNSGAEEILVAGHGCVHNECPELANLDPHLKELTEMTKYSFYRMSNTASDEPNGIYVTDQKTFKTSFETLNIDATSDYEYQCSFPEIPSMGLEREDADSVFAEKETFTPSCKLVENEKDLNEKLLFPDKESRESAFIHPDEPLRGSPYEPDRQLFDMYKEKNQAHHLATKNVKNTLTIWRFVYSSIGKSMAPMPPSCKLRTCSDDISKASIESKSYKIDKDEELVKKLRSVYDGCVPLGVQNQADRIEAFKQYGIDYENPKTVEYPFQAKIPSQDDNSSKYVEVYKMTHAESLALRLRKKHLGDAKETAENANSINGHVIDCKEISPMLSGTCSRSCVTNSNYFEYQSMCGIATCDKKSILKYWYFDLSKYFACKAISKTNTEDCPFFTEQFLKDKITENDWYVEAFPFKSKISGKQMSSSKQDLSRSRRAEDVNDWFKNMIIKTPEDVQSIPATPNQPKRFLKLNGYTGLYIDWYSLPFLNTDELQDPSLVLDMGDEVSRTPVNRNEPDSLWNRIKSALDPEGSPKKYIFLGEYKGDVLQPMALGKQTVKECPSGYFGSLKFTCFYDTIFPSKGPKSVGEAKWSPVLTAGCRKQICPAIFFEGSEEVQENIEDGYQNASSKDNDQNNGGLDPKTSGESGKGIPKCPAEYLYSNKRINYENNQAGDPISKWEYEEPPKLAVNNLLRSWYALYFKVNKELGFDYFPLTGNNQEEEDYVIGTDVVVDPNNGEKLTWKSWLKTRSLDIFTVAHDLETYAIARNLKIYDGNNQDIMPPKDSFGRSIIEFYDRQKHIVKMPFRRVAFGEKIKDYCNRVDGFGASHRISHSGIVYRQCVSGNPGDIIGRWKQIGALTLSKTADGTPRIVETCPIKYCEEEAITKGWAMKYNPISFTSSYVGPYPKGFHRTRDPHAPVLADRVSIIDATKGDNCGLKGFVHRFCLPKGWEDQVPSGQFEIIDDGCRHDKKIPAYGRSFFLEDEASPPTMGNLNGRTAIRLAQANDTAFINKVIEHYRAMERSGMKALPYKKLIPIYEQALHDYFVTYKLNQTEKEVETVYPRKCTESTIDGLVLPETHGGVFAVVPCEGDKLKEVKFLRNDRYIKRVFISPTKQNIFVRCGCNGEWQKADGKCVIPKCFEPIKEFMTLTGGTTPIPENYFEQIGYMTNTADTNVRPESNSNMLNADGPLDVKAVRLFYGRNIGVSTSATNINSIDAAKKGYPKLLTGTELKEMIYRSSYEDIQEGERILIPRPVDATNTIQLPCPQDEVTQKLFIDEKRISKTSQTLLNNMLSVKCILKIDQEDRELARPQFEVTKGCGKTSCEPESILNFLGSSSGSLGVAEKEFSATSVFSYSTLRCKSSYRPNPRRRHTLREKLMEVFDLNWLADPRIRNGKDGSALLSEDEEFIETIASATGDTCSEGFEGGAVRVIASNFDKGKYVDCSEFLQEHLDNQKIAVIRLCSCKGCDEESKDNDDLLVPSWDDPQPLQLLEACIPLICRSRESIVTINYHEIWPQFSNNEAIHGKFSAKLQWPDTPFKRMSHIDCPVGTRVADGFYYASRGCSQIEEDEVDPLWVERDAPHYAKICQPILCDPLKIDKVLTDVSEVYGSIMTPKSYINHVHYEDCGDITFNTKEGPESSMYFKGLVKFRCVLSNEGQGVWEPTDPNQKCLTVDSGGDDGKSTKCSLTEEAERRDFTLLQPVVDEDWQKALFGIAAKPVTGKEFFTAHTDEKGSHDKLRDVLAQVEEASHSQVLRKAEGAERLMMNGTSSDWENCPYRICCIPVYSEEPDPSGIQLTFQRPAEDHEKYEYCQRKCNARVCEEYTVIYKQKLNEEFADAETPAPTNHKKEESGNGT